MRAFLSSLVVLLVACGTPASQSAAPASAPGKDASSTPLTSDAAPPAPDAGDAVDAAPSDARRGVDAGIARGRSAATTGDARVIYDNRCDNDPLQPGCP